jgi:hypothetical protein
MYLAVRILQFYPEFLQVIRSDWQRSGLVLAVIGGVNNLSHSFSAIYSRKPRRFQYGEPSVKGIFC